MRFLIAILIGLLALIQYGYWWGHGGWLDRRHLQASIEQQRAEIGQLTGRNAILAAEVADLKQGMETIEELARSEMGMIEEDEEFYQFIVPRSATADAVIDRNEP